MRKEDKLFLLRYFLNIVNGVFLILGLMLVVLGVWIQLGGNRIFILMLSIGEHSLSASVSPVMLANGSIIVLIALLGCFGSLKGIKCLVCVYMGLLILAFVVQATLLVIVYTQKDRISNLWKIQMDEFISNYGNKTVPGKVSIWDIFNGIQRLLHCCGRYNSTDWKWNENKEHANQVPCSCTTYNVEKWFCNALENATYTRGCENDINKWYEENTSLFIAIQVGLLSIGILQFTLSTWLFRTMKKNKILPKN